MKKITLFTITIIMIMGMLLCGVAYADTGATDAIDITDLLNGLTGDAVAILGILGVLAFCVELVVQVTKEIPPISKIPTKLYVLIISLILCELALFVYGAWAGINILWYYIALAAFMSFVVSYISMYGWDTLKELYDRYTKLKGK